MRSSHIRPLDGKIGDDAGDPSTDVAVAPARPRNLSTRSAWRRMLAAIGGGALFALTPLPERFDGALLDVAFALERHIAPRAASIEIALVGIDDASFARIDLPFAVWHLPLAQTLEGIASASPRAVGIDIALPDRSYDHLVPDSDETLATALAATRQRAPVVLALTVDPATGTPRKVLPLFLAAAGLTANGYALWRPEVDGTVRRFDERVIAEAEPAPSFAGQLRRALGIEPQQPVPSFAGQLTRALGIEPQYGYIDYAIGAPFSYIPFSRVLDWALDNDVEALKAAFADRVVLVGSVLAFDDRHRQPVNLAGWDRHHEAPGMLATAQTLRAQAANAMIRPAGSPAIVALLILVCATPALARRGRTGLLIGGLLFLAVVLAGVLGLALQYWLPLSVMIVTVLLALLSIAVSRALQTRAERDHLKRTFGGFVSPPVLDALLDGSLRADRPMRAELAFLFADIRDFSMLTLTLTPERLYDALNRYYERLVAAIHAHGGTIDNFRGDGLMAFFGAPQPLENPARHAVQAASEAQRAIATLNGEFVREGLPPLPIAIGLALGNAVVGAVGASARNNYTALGHAANVAAHLQTLSKSEDGIVFATEEIVQRAGEASWREIGPRLMKGRVTATIFAMQEGA